MMNSSNTFPNTLKTYSSSSSPQAYYIITVFDPSSNNLSLRQKEGNKNVYFLQRNLHRKKVKGETYTKQQQITRQTLKLLTIFFQEILQTGEQLIMQCDSCTLEGVKYH